jgi:hypothetical protein
VPRSFWFVKLNLSPLGFDLNCPPVITFTPSKSGPVRGYFDDLLGPLRKKSQKNHPNVHKKIFDVAPIPKFNESDQLHKQLSDLGLECNGKVLKWLKSIEGVGKKSVGHLRKKVRTIISNELKMIDELFSKIIKSESKSYD